MAVAVKFENVSKRFTLHHQRTRSFQEVFVNLFRWNGSTEKFWVLKDITFEIQRGETFGIIGRNGAGKSTILKLVSRILEPTAGHITVTGKVSALLELGAGFHPDLTGKENIYLNGSLLGLSKREMRRKYDEIVEFSELQHFIDTPVRHYSSGMYMRLGFAIAVSVDPDILVTDEVLAVGDYAFQNKCREEITRLQDANKTIIVVSHDLETLRTYCKRAAWLDDGRIRAIGPADEVIDAYYGRAMSDANRADGNGQVDSTAVLPKLEGQAVSGLGYSPWQRWGSGEVQIESVELLDSVGCRRRSFESGERLTVRMRYFSSRRVDEPVFMVTLHRADGVYVCRNSTYADGAKFSIECGAGVVELDYGCLPLCRGVYSISVGVFLEPDDPFWSSPADLHDKAYEMEVHSGYAIHGLVAMPSSWSHLTKH